MKQNVIFLCSRSGKCLQGFCPTIVTTASCLSDTLKGWIRFSSQFGIKFYSFNGVVKPLF